MFEPNCFDKSFKKECNHVEHTSIIFVNEKINGTEEYMNILSCCKKNTIFSKLTEIYLKYCPLSVEGIRNITNLISVDDSSVTSLVLNSCEFTSVHFEVLNQFISNGKNNIQELDVSYNSVDEKSFVDFIEAIKINQKIRMLRLAVCNLTDQHCVNLVDILTNRSVEMINLNIVFNGIGIRGCYCVSRFSLTRDVKILHSANFGNTGIGKDGRLYNSDDNQKLITAIDNYMHGKTTLYERRILVFGLQHSSIFVPVDIIDDFKDFHAKCIFKIKPAFLF